MVDSDFHSRLASVVSARGLTPADASLKAGLPSGYIADILRRRYKPSTERFIALGEGLAVRLDWLGWGKGLRDVDPLSRLVWDYLNGLEKSDAIADADWDRLGDTVEAEEVRPYRDRLVNNPPPANSLDGIYAALELVRRETKRGGADDLATAVAGAALVYFRRAA